MKNRFKNHWSMVVIISSLLLLTSIAAGTHVQPSSPTPTSSSTRADYNGTLRVYAVEPVSRWNMYDGNPYHFATLAIVTQTDISLPSEGTFDQTYTWTGTAISDTNIMAMAAVFNAEGHQAYSYPPSSNPFTAHYVDAAAAATPDTTGYNKVNETYTHTVFVEEGTATWCHWCPYMADALKTIYDFGTYNFYYTALVDDMCPDAHTRLTNDYNLAGYPTAYYDGGYNITLGGYEDLSMYEPKINGSGLRAVPPLNLSVSLTIPSPNTLEIHVVLINNDVQLAPNTPTAPIGPATGVVNMGYQFSTVTTDPQNDPIYYLFDWGDGTNSSWVGPFASGTPGTATHTWTATGVYGVKVKAKDPSGHESSWSQTSTIVISGPSLTLTAKGTKGTLAVTVQNKGTETLTNLPWTIQATGGILNRININDNGTIAALAAGDTTTITSSRMFGLGSLTIKVNVAGVPLNKQGFILGPFIKL